MNGNADQLEGACDLGVVLFWIDRPKFGKYGYLAPYETQAKRARAVIYFDQDSLIDPSEPITEGSLVHYDVKEDDLEDRLKAGNVEVERFTTHLPQLDFKQSDLRYFPALKPTDPLGNALLTGLSSELKRSLERYCEIQRVITDAPLQELSRSLQALGVNRPEEVNEIPPELVNYLNKVTGWKLLFDKKSFARIKPTARRLSLLLYERKPQSHELRWLNRLLLEDAYPEALMPKPLNIDCSSPVYQATVVERDDESRTGLLKLDRGPSYSFSFGYFPTHALVPRAGDRVECRIYRENWPYDIWLVQQSNQAAAIKDAANRLQNVVAAVVPKLDASTSKIGESTTLLQAVTEDAKEAFEPILDYNGDSRLKKARADAKKAGIPELFVDVIAVRMKAGGKFPTTDILFRELSNPVLKEKLEAGGHGTSRPTVGRWLHDLKMILRQRGFPIPKSRLRDTNPQPNPAKSSQESTEEGETAPDGEDLPQDNETGPPISNTVGQELAGQVARQHKADNLDQVPQPTDTGPNWKELGPMLQEVMDELSPNDREVALLLLDGLKAAEIGDRLGLTEDTARKRVATAQSQLGSMLAKRGITSTDAARMWLDEGGNEKENQGKRDILGQSRGGRPFGLR